MVVHATPASATLAPFNRGARQLGQLFFPGSGPKFGTNSFLFGAIRRRGSPIVASAATGRNGGVVEVSEDERARRTYVWPDDKKPRVCILGGGFGGLYTALRLESLEWPRDKKPQREEAAAATVLDRREKKKSVVVDRRNQFAFSAATVGNRKRRTEELKKLDGCCCLLMRYDRKRRSEELKKLDGCCCLLMRYDLSSDV